jgi:hypothetical protein
MIGKRFKIYSVPWIGCCVLLLSIFVAVCSGEAADQPSVREAIDTRNSPYSFQMTVPGNVDESRFLWPNLPGETSFFSAVRIRNTGEDPIVNPRLTLNGFQMPLTTKELMFTIIGDAPDALDRILRVFYTMTRYVTHYEMPNADPIHPLGFFLNYCYGVCFDQMGIQAGLWEVMGFPWRFADPMNHATAEVEHPQQKKMMLLDTDFNAYYLRHDNWSIASAQDVREDPMLVLRSTHEREYHRSPWQEGDPIVDMWGSSEKMAALYAIRPSRPLNKTRSGPYLNEKLTIVLRPGESYGWHSDRNQYHESLKENPPIMNVSRQLTWETDLDLSKPHHRWFLKGKKTQKSNNGSQQATLDHRQSWQIPYRLLFPVLGMNLSLKLDPDSPNQMRKDATVVRIVLKTPAKSVGEDVPLEKLVDHSYSLDSLLYKLPYPVRDVEVIISIKSPGKNSGRSLNVKGLQIRLLCQSTAFACRSLQMGQNQIIYTDASGKRDVRIEIETHPETVPLPHFSESVFSPGNGEGIAESALQFLWPAVPENDGAVGYQWQVSAHQDMRYPLSPTFERLLNGTFLRHENGNVIFELPWRGMLPVGRELYWRVRPYDRKNLAGDWSPVKSFKIRGPGVPQNVRLVTKNGNNILMWDRNPQGTAPVKYEIHTSSLEGFMPTDKRHRILGMSSSEVMKYQWTDVYASDWPVVPPTLLTTTDQREWIVFDENGPRKILPSKLGAHYRIIAIDAEKSRSCPSPQIHLPHPRIVSPLKVILSPGVVRWQVPVISSLGRVLATDPGYRLGLWEKPTLRYSLLDAPKGDKDWAIDQETGVIHGKLARGQAVSLTVQVHDTRYDVKDVKRVVFQSK